MKEAYIKLHISIFLWGFTGILGKAISLGEGWLVWYRLLFTSVLLAIFILFAHKNLLKTTVKAFLEIGLIGLVLAVHWVFFYASIKTSNVSIALSCFASTALFTSLLDPLIQRKLPNWRELLLGMVAIAGIYLIYSFQEFYLKGILFALLSACLAALLTIGNSRLVKKYHPVQVSFLEMSSGFIVLSVLLPFYFMFQEAGSAIPTNEDLLWLFLLSSICTVVPFILSMQSLQKVSPFAANLSLNLEPIYTIILAIWIYKENKDLNAGFYIGTGLILSTVFAHTIYKLTTKRKTVIESEIISQP